MNSSRTKLTGTGTYKDGSNSSIGEHLSHNDNCRFLKHELLSIHWSNFDFEIGNRKPLTSSTVWKF